MIYPKILFYLRKNLEGVEVNACNSLNYTTFVSINCNHAFSPAIVQLCINQSQEESQK